MKTWTKHPVPLKATDFVWVKGDAWASQVVEKNGKFQWCTAVEHGTTKEKANGVAVADNPLGHFKDAKGSANDITKEEKAMQAMRKDVFGEIQNPLFHTNLPIKILKGNT